MELVRWFIKELMSSRLVYARCLELRPAAPDKWMIGPCEPLSSLPILNPPHARRGTHAGPRHLSGEWASTGKCVLTSSGKILFGEDGRNKVHAGRVRKRFMEFTGPVRKAQGCNVGGVPKLSSRCGIWYFRGWGLHARAENCQKVCSWRVGPILWRRNIENQGNGVRGRANGNVCQRSTLVRRDPDVLDARSSCPLPRTSHFDE